MNGVWAGALVTSPQGVKANPAAVEARQQRIALARLLAALRLPSLVKRRLPEPVRTVEPMPALLRGPLRAHMAVVYDRHELVPATAISTHTAGTADEQCAGWRWCRAFRRASNERLAWLVAHGYSTPGGHVDWHRFRADHPVVAS